MDGTSLSHYETRVQVRSQGRLLQAPRIFFTAVDDPAATAEGLRAVRQRYSSAQPGLELVSVEVLDADSRRVAFLEGAGLRAVLDGADQSPAP